MPRRDALLLGTLLGAALALRVTLALVIPPFQAPDEAAHLRYVEVFGRTHRLPVQPPKPGPHWEQFYQPPLAYATFVPIDKALSAAGLFETSRLRGVRITNAMYGTLTVLIGYAVAARLGAQSAQRFLVAGVIALFPGFAANASVVNNDTLANLLAALLWLPLLGGADGRLRVWMTGVVFGLACLAKLSVLALGPLLFLVPLLRPVPSLRDAFRHALGASAVAAIILMPWMLRNYQLYGNPLAIGVGSISFASLAEVLPADAVVILQQPQPGRVFSQFWGHFGIHNNLQWKVIPTVLVPIVALAALGWARPRTGPGPAPVSAQVSAIDGVRLPMAFAAAMILAAAGLTAFSIRYTAAWQGRYLYTTVVPFAVLLAVGWHRMLPPRARPAFTAVLIAVLVVLDVVLVARLHEFFTHVPHVRWGLGRML